MTFACIHCLQSLDQEHFRADFRNGKLARDPRCNECRKIAFISRNFAITRQEYHALMNAAGHKCEICGSKETTGRSGRMTIDRDHITGKLRGVLCHSCNCAIHQFMTPRILGRLADYLERTAKATDSPMTERDHKRLENFSKMRLARQKFSSKSHA